MNDAVKSTLLMCKSLCGYIKLWTLVTPEAVSSKSTTPKPTRTAFFSRTHIFQPPLLSGVIVWWGSRHWNVDGMVLVSSRHRPEKPCAVLHIYFSLLSIGWMGRRIQISVRELRDGRILGPCVTLGIWVLPWHAQKFMYCFEAVNCSKPAMLNANAEQLYPSLTQ